MAIIILKNSCDQQYLACVFITVTLMRHFTEVDKPLCSIVSNVLCVFQCSDVQFVSVAAEQTVIRHFCSPQ